MYLFFIYLVNYCEVYQLQTIFLSLCDVNNHCLMQIDDFSNYIDKNRKYICCLFNLYKDIGVTWNDFFVTTCIICLFNEKTFINCLFYLLDQQVDRFNIV